MKRNCHLGAVALCLLLGGFVAWLPTVARPGDACDEKIFDDGTIANAFYFTDSVWIMARRFDGSASPVGMEWGEINTISLGDPFYPWPDPTYDPIEITVWEGDTGNELPVYPPIWTTVVTPSDSPSVVRVYPPDTILSSSSIIYLGMRNPQHPDRAEGLCVDGHRDFPGTYRSTDGGLTWQVDSGFGDWHIRACLIYRDAVEEELETRLPSCRLFPAAPNPFSRSTVIRYSLPTACHMNLCVYDVTGSLVETLVDGDQDPGVFQVQWGGKGQPDGIYFYRLRAGDFAETRKLVLLR